MNFNGNGYITKSITINTDDGDQTISGWSKRISSNNDYINSSIEVFLFYKKHGILQKVNHGEEHYMNNWNKNRHNFSLSRTWVLGKLNHTRIYETDFVKYEGNFSVTPTADGRNILITGQWQGKKYIKQDYSNSILVYAGDFYNDEYHGIGTSFYVCPRRIYKYCNDDTYDPELDTRTKMYVGHWQHGKKDGLGNFYYSNEHIKYEGYIWKNDSIHSGLGKYYSKICTVGTECAFKDGKKDGPWKIYYENGLLEFEGDYKDDKKEGKGISYYQSGSIIYNGFWKNNIVCDFGFFYGIHDITDIRDIRDTLLLTQKEDDHNTSISIV